MLEIFLIFVWLSLMAKAKPQKRRRFNLRRVKLTPSLSLGTLASVTALTTGLTGAADGQYRMMSVKGSWSVANMTAGEGPLRVGYAHSDYSVTEIKEAIEAAASISIGDKIANEQANRLVRTVGVFSGLNTDETLNDGKPITTKLNWAIPIGDFVNMFIYNDSGGSLTTGGLLHFNGDCWVKDT